MGKTKKKRAVSSSEDDSSSSTSDESSEDSDASSSSLSSSSSPSPEKKARKNSASSLKKKKRKKEKKKKSKKKKKSGKKSSSSSKLKDLPKISVDDYYSRNSEFRAWIKSNEKIKKTFADMETTEAKTLFKKFVKKWNEKKLSKDFYRGTISGSSGGGGGDCGKSGFQWGFAQNMDSKTKSEIDAVRRGNEREFGAGKKEKVAEREGQTAAEMNLRQMAPSSSKSDGGSANGGGSKDDGPKMIGPSMPAHIAQNQESSSEDEQEAYERKMQEKRYRDFVKTTEEELCPKATGHEAKLEKKAMARERRRQRDTSPGLSDKVLLGDSSRMGKAIQSRKAERSAKQEVSVARAKEKVNAYAEREKAKMDALLEMAKASKKEGALW